MVNSSFVSESGGLMNIISSGLYGVAAALVVGTVPLYKVRITRPSLSGRRRTALQDAAGPVLGTESTLRRIEMQQLLALSTASIAVVVLFVSQPNILNFFASVFIVFAAWNAPLLIARAREKRRREAVDVELNDTLGEMVMGVEAGLTLESVMNLYAQRHQTELASEFLYLLARINLGTSRLVALNEFRDRTPTLNVQMFVSAVQQNQKLGTPLAEVLRQQSHTSRRRRRQAVEEAAAKLSLKMIFPTVFCVLPVLLIVIVGPSVIRLIEGLP
jgi:tight adherence protein C